VELISLGIVGRLLYRWARSRLPVSGRRMAAVAVLTQALDVALLWLGLVYVPNHFDADLPVLVRMVPDAGLFMVPALVLAAAWCVVRSALMAWLWYRSRRGPLPDAIVEAHPADLMAPFG
jgi:hypothetical protein